MRKPLVKPNFKRTKKGLIFEVKNYYPLVRQRLLDDIEFSQRLSQVTPPQSTEIVSDMVILELYTRHFVEPFPKARITLRFSEALALSYVLLGTEIGFLAYEIHGILKL